MTRFQVDSDAVFTATAAIRNSIGRIQSEVGGLQAQLADLQSSWSGTAATAFHSVITDWKATQQRVEESLAAINQALSQAGQQYADTEAQNARMFSR